MIDEMATVRITEAELARDVHAVLANVQQGLEVVIEQDHRPVAILRLPHRRGSLVSEILREARRRNSTVALDEDFGKDMEGDRRQPTAAMESALLGVVLNSSTVSVCRTKRREMVSVRVGSRKHTLS